MIRVLRLSLVAVVLTRSTPAAFAGALTVEGLVLVLT